MHPTQTGIATALALAVVVMFFILPGLSPFGRSQTATADQTLDLQTAPQGGIDTTTMPTDATQLQVLDEIVGTGVAAEAGDEITVNYVGALTNGQVFDASANQGPGGFKFTLGVGQVIQGWDQGLVGMKEGGKRKLIIPASLAYGDQSPAPSIPPNSTLVFEVELLKVEKAAQ